MSTIKLKALAKINLGLDVIRKREDGYHEVRMIMQTINLYDRIQISTVRRPGIMIKTNLHYLPTNESNLVYKAAKILMDEFNINQGIFVNLDKHIPVAAGLAGGSSDGAAVLFGMNRLFGLNLTKKELMDRALHLGADVPYCVIRGTALSEGIGERLTVLPPFPKCFILIAKPGVSVSTKFVYENLKLNQITYKPDIDGMIDAIKEGDLYGVTKRMSNILETVTIREYPIIEEIKDIMKEHGALNAIMSGSGPTVFGIFDRYDIAKKAYYHIKTGNLVKQVFLTDLAKRG